MLLVALIAVAVPWIIAGRTLANPPDPPVSSAKTSGVVWGGLVFTTRRPLHHWLHVHGVAYSVWAGRHPPAANTVRR